MSTQTQNAVDRASFIGGSDAAAILGVSPWKSPFMLYQEKIGEFKEEITPEKQKIFDRGHRWEPVVIEMLIDELTDRGHDVQVIARNGRFKDLEHPFLAAEIDLELLIDGETVNGEMKTVHPFAAKDWGEQDTDEIPIYYTAQVSHGQMVTRRNKTIVAALIGADDLRVHVVERDDELIQIMRNKEIEFWKRIEKRDAPDPTSLEDIKLIYSKAGGGVVDADQKILEAFTNLKNTKSKLKGLEEEKEAYEKEIKLFMGEAAVLSYEEQALLTWRNNKDSVKTNWEDAFWKLVGETNNLGQADIDKFVRDATKTVPGARVLRLK